MTMMDDKVSLLNEPIAFRDTGDATVLHRLPKARPIHAAIAETLANVELLLAQLEAGIRVADSQRGLVRELFVATQRQRDVLAAACDWKSWNRALLPVIGWTERPFELLQGVSKIFPMLHQRIRLGAQIIVDRPPAIGIEAIEPSPPFRRQAQQD